jgi:hypothetical protein
MNTTIWKNHAIGIGVLLLAIGIFCIPAIQGKKLYSHDYVSWEYMSQESKVVSQEQKSNAFWTNAQFGGLPSFTTYGNNTGNWLGALQYEILPKFIPRPLFILFITAMGFYLLGCALGFSLWLRVLLGIAGIFSSYNPILAAAGHDTKLIAIGTSAGVIAGLFYLIKGRTYTGFAIYTLFFSLMFISGHYQVIYYILLSLVIFALFTLANSIKDGTLSKLILPILLVLAGSIVGLFPASQQVLMVKDYTNATMRGGKSDLTLNKKDKKTNKTNGLDIEYAFRWSQGVGETFSLLVPTVMGPIDQKYFEEGYTADKLSEIGAPTSIASQLPTYWGPQPFISGPVYFGAIVILLFIFGMFTVQSNYKWWIAISCLIFIVLSWGRNFMGLNQWLFEHLPMYNKFRTPSMALIIPQILMPMLGVWGLHDVIKGGIQAKQKAWQALKYAAGITIALVLIGGVFSSMWQTFDGEAIKEVKQQLAQSFKNPSAEKQLISAMEKDMAAGAQADGIKSLIWVLLGCAILFVVIKQKLQTNIAVILLSLLIFADLFMVGKRYLKDENYLDKEDYTSQSFSPRPVDEQILKDKDPYYRVQDLSTNTYNDARPAYFHKLVGGYHPAKMEIYQDLIDMQLSRNNREVYNMLNTKYFIVPGQNKEPQVMPNPATCGNAWFVNQIKTVANADEEMLALNAPSLGGDTTLKGDFNPRTTAIVKKDRLNNAAKLTFDKDSTANIKLTKYGLNDLEFSSTNKNDGYAVFSDIYYDGGWSCLIDGKPAPIIRTNYVLRGVFVPAGNHKIEFHFLPPKANLGRMLGTIGSILTLAIFAFGMWRGKSETSEDEIIDDALVTKLDVETKK